MAVQEVQRSDKSKSIINSIDKRQLGSSSVVNFASYDSSLHSQFPPYGMPTNNIFCVDATPSQIAVLNFRESAAWVFPRHSTQYHNELFAAIAANLLANPGDRIFTDCVGCLFLGKRFRFMYFPVILIKSLIPVR